MTDLNTFIQTIFEPGDIIELRCIKKKSVKKFWVIAKDLPSMNDELHDLNQQGYNIYYGVNPRKEKGVSGDANVKLARCLFCDFDNIETGDGCGRWEFIENDIFFARLPQPTLAVHSGHGVHTYWRLDEPIHDLSVWKSTQEKLNNRLGADKTIKNPERIMRLPGFLNTKKEPFQECFMCWSADRCRQSQ